MNIPHASGELYPSTPPGAAYARFPRRLMAIMADAAVLMAAFLVLVVVATSTGLDTVIRSALVILLLALLLYDPILVSRTGGTLGHHWLNLRVVADESAGNLPFGRALIRGFVKGILGLPSFVFMVVTPRHQALHDLASRSTVQVKDLSRAATYHYVTERPAEAEPVGVSRRRRVLTIAAYCIVIYLLLSVLTAPFISDPCAFSNACSPAENFLFTVFGALWLGTSGAVLVQGWRGRLPGCRPRPGTGGSDQTDSAAVSPTIGE